MRIVSIISSLMLLFLAAKQDIKERQFYMIYPIVLFVINDLIRARLTGIYITAPEMFFASMAIGCSVASQQKIGLGDALVIIGILPLCSIYGVLRILIDGLLIVSLWNQIKKKYKKQNYENETAFIPFLTIGFMIWIIT